MDGVISTDRAFRIWADGAELELIMRILDIVGIHDLSIKVSGANTFVIKFDRESDDEVFYRKLGAFFMALRRAREEIARSC